MTEERCPVCGAKAIIDSTDKYIDESLRVFECGHAHRIAVTQSGVIAEPLISEREKDHEIERLKGDLKEALLEWRYSAGYKGGYLVQKHADMEASQEIADRWEIDLH